VAQGVVQTEVSVGDESTTITVTLRNGVKLGLELPKELTTPEAIYSAELEVWNNGQPAIHNAMREMVGCLVG